MFAQSTPLTAPTKRSLSLYLIAASFVFLFYWLLSFTLIVTDLCANWFILQILLDQINAFVLRNFSLAFLKLLIVFASWASIILQLPITCNFISQYTVYCTNRTALEQDDRQSSASLSPTRRLLCFQTPSFARLSFWKQQDYEDKYRALAGKKLIAAIRSTRTETRPSATVCTTRLVWTDPESNAVTARSVLKTTAPDFRNTIALGRFPGFARLSFYQEQHVCTIHCQTNSTFGQAFQLTCYRGLWSSDHTVQLNSNHIYHLVYCKRQAHVL